MDEQRLDEPDCPGRPTSDLLVWKRIRYRSRLTKAVSHVENHLGRRISLQEVADAACMEKTAFSKFFRRATGQKFRDFLQNLRIEKAIGEMTSSDISLTEIAFNVGFESLASFERAFRKFKSMTPSSYRRSLLQQKGIVISTRNGE
jgi:transcriptional regulator GlxA family with amidase domain